MMSKVAFKYRFRVVLACLLSFCLSHAAAETHRPDIRDNIGAGSDNVAYILDATSVPSAFLLAEKRNRLKNVDHLTFLCHGQAHIAFDSTSYCFCSHEYNDFITATDLPAVLIRAPPFHHA